MGIIFISLLFINDNTKAYIPVSDGWATDDLVYQWKEVDPVQIVPGRVSNIIFLEMNLKFPFSINPLIII